MNNYFYLRSLLWVNVLVTARLALADPEPEVTGSGLANIVFAYLNCCEILNFQTFLSSKGFNWVTKMLTKIYSYNTETEMLKKLIISKNVRTRLSCVNQRFFLGRGVGYSVSARRPTPIPHLISKLICC